MQGLHKRYLDESGMKIASVIDVSLVDVPGIPVTVIFTAGCNFDCPYCQNASIIPLSSGTEMTVDEVVRSASGHLVDGYSITGGEPTLQKELPQLVRALSKTGNLHINLNTQGSNPAVLADCIPHLDSVWFDLKASPKRYPLVCRTKSTPWPKVEESFKMLLDSRVELWPRTTYVEGLLTLDDINDILHILEEWGFEGRYRIQDYIPSAGVRESESKRLKRPRKEDLIGIVEKAPETISVEIQFR